LKTDVNYKAPVNFLLSWLWGMLWSFRSILAALLCARPNHSKS